MQYAGVDPDRTFDYFSENARKALECSWLEALRLNHDYIGTEHILLGICASHGNVRYVLQDLGVDTQHIRGKVLSPLKAGSVPLQKQQLPFTARGRKALELAITESRAMGCSYVGTEHLLLGLLAEDEGLAAQVLKDCRLELAVARSIVKAHARIDPLPASAQAAVTLERLNAPPTPSPLAVRARNVASTCATVLTVLFCCAAGLMLIFRATLPRAKFLESMHWLSKAMDILGPLFVLSLAAWLIVLAVGFYRYTLRQMMTVVLAGAALASVAVTQTLFWRIIGTIGLATLIAFVVVDIFSHDPDNMPK